jgi:hypothetical protein
MLNPDIIKAVSITAELTGAQLSEGAMEAMCEHLSGYATDAVLKALHRCQLELRGPLSLGAVMDRLDDGHPGPEIAWAMVARLGEDDSVVWTEEIAQSFGVVRGMLADRVGARLAFLEAYRTRLAEARAAQRAPVWWASLGYDPAGRAGVIREAIEKGRLAPAAARRMLPPHEWPAEMLPEATALGEGQRNATELVQDLTRKIARDARDQEADR